MAAASAVPRLTEEEYLERERSAFEKSEFILGDVFAMASGAPRHNLLGANAITCLNNALASNRCLVFSSDMKVLTPSSRSFCYPDAAVVCGEPKFDAKQTDVLLNPVALFEVLSPSTANYDRGLKFSLYREIASIREYVLIHPETAWIEHFSRTGSGQWLLTDIRGLDATLSLPALSIEVPLASLYRGVFELPA